jgi:hypothetical protein
MIADAATTSSPTGSRRPTVPLTPVVNAGPLAARPRLSSFATPAEASTNARVVRIAVPTLLVTSFASSHRQPFVGTVRQQSVIRSNGRACEWSRRFAGVDNQKAPNIRLFTEDGALGRTGHASRMAFVALLSGTLPSDRERGIEMRRLPLRDQAQLVVAAVAGVLCLLTIVWPDWIEGLTGFDPDHHSGWAEWLIVIVLALICIVCAVRARNALRVTPALDRRR